MIATILFFLGVAFGIAVGRQSKRLFTSDDDHLWTKLAQKYGKDDENTDKANHFLMVQLLARGRARPYYYECWRNSIVSAPPPPYEMAFPPEPERVKSNFNPLLWEEHERNQQQTKQNYESTNP